MGIYIKKVLGYGLQMKATEVSDILNREVIRKLYGMSAADYKEFLQNKYGPETLEEAMSDLGIIGTWENEEYRASDFITVAESRLDGEDESETDLAWIVITPPMVCKEWKHNDNAIDYAEAMYKYQDTDFQFDADFKLFNQGLYPYDGAYTNHKTGERFNSQNVSLVHRYLKMMDTESTPAEETTLRLLLATLKVSSVEEFHAVIHPAPPQPVLDIAEWTGVFKDESIARKLRPSLLTYWS